LGCLHRNIVIRIITAAHFHGDRIFTASATAETMRAARAGRLQSASAFTRRDFRSGAPEIKIDKIRSLRDAMTAACAMMFGSAPKS
jgi:hypothetical protein